MNAVASRARRPSDQGSDLSWYSIGREVLRANGLEGRAYTVYNAVGPDDRFLFPDKGVNWASTAVRAVAAVSHDETVITTRMIDGHLQYLEGIGLIPDTARVIQVDPEFVRTKKVFGYPYNDAVEQLRQQKVTICNDGTGYLIPAFSCPQVDEQARSIGLNPVGFPDSHQTNNKRFLRLDSDSFGHTMAPGAVIEDWKDVRPAARQFGGSKHGAWLKLDYAGGGMLVMEIPRVTADSVIREMRKIRHRAIDAFKLREAAITIARFWPKQKVSPKGLAFVLESSAKNSGPIAVNVNTQIMTYKTGEIRIVCHTKQLTGSDGEFLGSVRFHPSEQVRADIEDQATKAARSIQARGYYGILGVDSFLLSDGKVLVTEVNARPNSSTFPTIAAAKLGATEWVSFDVKAHASDGSPRYFMNISDYVDIVGRELAVRGNPRDGLVVPLSFQTYVSGPNVVPDASVKIMVMARDVQRRDEIVQELHERGLRRE